MRGARRRVLRLRCAAAADTPRPALWLRLTACGSLAAGILLVAATGPSAAQNRAPEDQPRVLVTTIDGTITPVVADYLSSVVNRAEDDDYNALVVQIDTPGGLDSSMRQIVQRFLRSEAPIIAYVSPDGARAASAGSFIAQAANIAAMAPGTAIGAATPVQVSGEDVSDSERKAINDAAAYAESIAELRDRNVEFARETVLDGRSASASEALELGAVDLLAPSLTALLEEVDGRRVEIADDRTVTLRTANAVVDEADMGLFRQIQQFLADPNLAFLFLSIGTLGLIYELANPGLGAAGIVGAILIILALFGIAVLPVNAVGLLLFGVAVALFIAELFAPGVGVAAAGGTVALLMSGIFLFRDAPGFQVGLGVLVPIVAVAGGAVILAGRLVMRARKSASTTTGEGLFIGRVVTVDHITDEPGRRRGMTFVEGAWWTVRSAGPALQPGESVVVGMDGLTLLVEPGTDLSSPAAGTSNPADTDDHAAGSDSAHTADHSPTDHSPTHQSPPTSR